MKVGVIGYGAIAKKVYFPIIEKLGLEIVGVADLSTSRLKQCNKKYGIKTFTDYNSLLKEDLDLVIISTPNSTHHRMTIDAAKAGKNILIEKPMAINATEAGEMVAACQKEKVKLCVMHNYRFFPCIIEAKKRIELGRIGKILEMSISGYINIPLSWSRSTWVYGEWGLLDDFGVHLLSIINYLVDSKPVSSKTYARDVVGNMSTYNNISSMILFENDTCVNMSLSWVFGSYENHLKIQGTAGTLYIDIRNNNLWETHGYITPIDEIRNTYKKVITIGKELLNKSYFKGATNGQYIILNEFIKSIEQDTKPPVPGEEGKEVIEIMDLIKQSVSV